MRTNLGLKAQSKTNFIQSRDSIVSLDDGHQFIGTGSINEWRAPSVPSTAAVCDRIGKVCQVCVPVTYASTRVNKCSALTLPFCCFLMGKCGSC